MSEFESRPPELLIEAVRASENEKEESWREVFLAKNLFHEKHYEEAVENNPLEKDGLLYLEHQFLAEKRGKNMGERFEMALSETYLGKIHIVELGLSTNPCRPGEVEHLKDEYRKHLRWMIDHGIVEGELPREESGRNVSVRQPVQAEAADKFAIMIRNRPLIETQITHDGKTVDIAITKRMVFAIPLKVVATIFARHHDLNTETSLRHIEGILQYAPDAVQPIRTAYYLGTDLKSR